MPRTFQRLHFAAGEPFNLRNPCFSLRFWFRRPRQPQLKASEGLIIGQGQVHRVIAFRQGLRGPMELIRQVDLAA